MKNESASVMFGADTAPSHPAGYGVVAQKYGRAAYAGFQAVPDLLLKKQVALKLSPLDVVVLLNVLMHWWYADQKPFPRATTVAKRMGVTPRTVQRSIHFMSKSGILAKVVGSDGRSYLDPQPLVEKLEELAEEDQDYGIRKKRIAV